MSEPVFVPGSTLGILGSGQLGRMMTVVAKQMGYHVVVMGKDRSDPAAQVTHEFIEGDVSDPDAVIRLAGKADVITVETENVTCSGLKYLEEAGPVRPGSKVLSVAQDRLREKRVLQGIDIPVAPFKPVETLSDLLESLETLGCPCILKTTRGGYDGKGQIRIDRPSEAEAAFTALGAGKVGLLAETVVPFEKELSVIVARGTDGTVSHFPVCENRHINGILHRTIVPARISPTVKETAFSLAERIATELEVVGLITVEMFLVHSNQLLINELAPRPHNSGHHTIDVCATSQFEQHLRAVFGVALSSPNQLVPAAVMINVLGEHLPGVMDNYPALLNDPNLKVHLYGKADARPGRKMGHITVTDIDTECAIDRAERTYATISSPS